MHNTKNLRKSLSALLVLVLAITAVLPLSVFAAVATPTAVATLVENDGGGQTKKITISFDEEMELVPAEETDAVITASGTTFADSNMYMSATETDLIIELSAAVTVAVGDTITFQDGKIKNTSGEFFSGDVTIGGSFAPARIDYTGIVPSDAVIKVTGYTTPPEELGTGTFNYTLTHDDYVDQTGSFTVAQSDLGHTVYVTDTMTTAKKTVPFIAVGVAEDVSANYGKATKLVLVFAEPIDASAADVLDRLSVKGDISSASWEAGTDQTVLNLALKTNAAISNSTEITYTADDSIKTKLSAAVVNTNTVTAIGNFDGAESSVTATQMAATIVKASAKPGVNQNDKIIIVFNAPVKNSPEVITINDMTADAVTGTDHTVYRIRLAGDETINNTTTLSYAGMTTSLAGSFGSAEAPKALKAYAVDCDGTELVAGDQIIVQFNAPTNGAGDILNVGLQGNGYAAGLGSASTMKWDDTKTRLIITLGRDAVVKDGVKIGLKGLGIKDSYGLVAAEADSLVLTVEGSFGYTVEPRIVKAIAFSQGESDYIRVFFNTTVADISATKEEPSFTNDFKMGSGAEYELKTSSSLTYYEVKMDKSAHSALQPGTAIALTGINIVDAETKSKSLLNTSFNISGGFVSPITPEIQNVVALSNDGSGVAKKGDRIVVIFNTEVSGGTVRPENGTSFGSDYGTELSGNVLTITLGTEPSVNIGTELEFTGFKDKATLSADMPTTHKAISGSFGKIIEPEIISATAISKEGIGIPKAGDKIVVVFNTEVEINGNKYFVYEYELTDNLSSYETGKTFEITVTSVSTGKQKRCTKEITGTYGLKAVPSVKSVVLSGAGGYETITVVFDRATNGPGFTGTEFNTLYTNNKHLATDNTVSALNAAWESGNTVLKITLPSTATTTDTDTLNLSELGIASKDTGEAIEGLDALEIKGTLYPVVETAAVAADGTTVVIKFSARTNGDKAAAQAAVTNMKVLFGASASADWKNNNTELHIKMSDDNTMSDNAYIVLNSFEIFDGFSETYKIVGQYKITTDLLTKKTLAITSVFVKANNTDNAPREDITKGAQGDNIIVRFADVTDKAAGADAAANVELVSGESFGTGYTAVWSDYKTIVITLGEGTTVTTASRIRIKDVHFANGTGYLAAGSTNAVESGLTGQFDGRKYWIVNPDKQNVNGRVRVVGMINKADITDAQALSPFVVCQAYNSAGTVISINAASIADSVSNNVVFDFDAANLSKIKLFVLGGDYTDPDATVTVYSETVEK